MIFEISTILLNLVKQNIKILLIMVNKKETN